MIRRPGWLAAIVLAYLASHLLFLAPSLETIDSINFALGLRHFSPALHQPHPPGYPVYIALAHVSLAIVQAVMPAMAQVRAEALALALWSAMGGALALLAGGRLFAAVERRVSADRATGASSVRTTCGVALLAVCPLFWMSGLRPMSDMLGLAGVLWSQALVLEGRWDRRRLVLGAFLAALAAGTRIQTLALTLPFLALVALERQPDGRRMPLGWLVTRPIAMFGAGLLLWGVPLITVSGGVAAYLRALGSQAGEDFAWVDMLWSDPTPRKIAVALYDTAVLPWSGLPLAAVVVGLAALGALVAFARARAALGVMLLGFVPYTIYHLLFQAPAEIRYALPLMPLVAWLAVAALSTAGRWTVAVAVPVIAAALVVAVPGGIAYGRAPHPAYRALADAAARARVMPPAASFAHYSLRRALQSVDDPSLRFAEPRREYEWLGAVDYWRQGGTAPIWFFADPIRTDLDLIDPRSRRDVVRYRWAAADRLELNGALPLGADWYRITPPSWFVGEGWSLTPEAGGVTRANAAGPDVRPIEGWIRRRATPTRVLIGGRHLGPVGAGAADVELAVDDAIVDRWRVEGPEQNFLRFVDLPAAGAQGADGYARLVVRSRAVRQGGGRPEIAIRQFDAQAASEVIAGFGEGWHEEEYAPETGQRWRWTSERSVLQVRGPDAPIRVSLRGESPLKYFDEAPLVTLKAGGRVIARTRPAADFEWSVVVPADAWRASGGAVSIEVDRVYLPGAAEGTGDLRHLGLRLYETRVEMARVD